MLVFKIVPNFSVGVVAFGDSSDVVRAKNDLPYSYSEIPLTKNYLVRQDFFPGIRAKLEYNDKDQLHTIEFFRPPRK